MITRQSASVSDTRASSWKEEDIAATTNVEGETLADANGMSELHYELDRMSSSSLFLRSDATYLHFFFRFF